MKLRRCPTCPRWRQSRAVHRLASWAYSMGIISGSGTSWGGPEQHNWCLTHVHFRGRRPYIIGKQPIEWGCLLKRHHRHVPLYPGSWVCCVCCACPDCGSKTPAHAKGCPA